MKRTGILLITLLMCLCGRAATDTPDTLVVARDGSGQFRNIWDAIEDCRAFMDYHKVITVLENVGKALEGIVGNKDNKDGKHGKDE